MITAIRSDRLAVMDGWENPARAALQKIWNILPWLAARPQACVQTT